MSIKKNLAGWVCSHAGGKVKKVYNLSTFLGTRTNPQTPATTTTRRQEENWQPLGHPNSGTLCFPSANRFVCFKDGTWQVWGKKKIKNQVRGCMILQVPYKIKLGSGASACTPSLPGWLYWKWPLGTQTQERKGSMVLRMAGCDARSWWRSLTSTLQQSRTSTQTWQL